MSKESDSPTFRLLAACDRGDVETVRNLAEKGVDVNVRDDDDSALYRAAKQGHVQVLKILLQHEANVNATNGRLKWSALMVARQIECLSVVKLLLQHGANVNVRGKSGVSALFIASKCGSREVVEMLLIHGADVNIQNSRGRSVPMVASENDNVDK